MAVLQASPFFGTVFQASQGTCLVSFTRCLEAKSKFHHVHQGQCFFFFFWRFLQFLCNSQSGNDPEEDLVRFGYKPNMKVNFLKHPFIFLATYLNHVYTNMVENLKKPHYFNSFNFLYLILAISSQQEKGWSGVMAQHGTTKVWGSVLLFTIGSNLSYCIKDLLFFCSVNL